MRLKFNNLIILLITLLFAYSVQISAQKTKESSDLKNWPKRFSPVEVGRDRGIRQKEIKWGWRPG